MQISKTSRAFDCLRGLILNNSILSILTKRAVYKATVLSVLMYGAETWTLKAKQVRRLTTFHNKCVRIISAMGDQVVIKYLSQPVWHDVVHARHHHGQEVAVAWSWDEW